RADAPSGIIELREVHEVHSRGALPGLRAVLHTPQEPFVALLVLLLGVSIVRLWKDDAHAPSQLELAGLAPHFVEDAVVERQQSSRRGFWTARQSAMEIPELLRGHELIAVD